MPDVSELDGARQERAREYAALRRRLYVVDLAIGAVFVVAAIASGAAFALRDLLEGLTSSAPAVVALFFLAFWGAYAALTFPLSLYSGYMLPRRYGLSVQTAGAWLADWSKGLALSLVVLIVLVEIVYFLLAWLPSLWWLITGVVVLLGTVVLAQLTPVLLIPLFYKLTPVEDAGLIDRLRLLAERAGARVRGVYRINLSSKTTAANAALVGLGRTRRVVLGDTLLDRYTPEEIETVFAHELGHHVHRDIPKLVAFQTMLTLVGLYLVDQFLRWGVVALGYRSIADVAGLPLVALALGAFGVVTMPIGNAFSRHVEAAADRYALEVTGRPEAFISAMTRLANQNLAEYSPPRWVEVLFYDHPALSRRVRRAEELMRRDDERADEAA